MKELNIIKKNWYNLHTDSDKNSQTNMKQNKQPIKMNNTNKEDEFTYLGSIIYTIKREDLILGVASLLSTIN